MEIDFYLTWLFIGAKGFDEIISRQEFWGLMIGLLNDPVFPNIFSECLNSQSKTNRILCDQLQYYISH